jgi:Antirepressor regulating drug resistance, predicted signal transduction N-terminal membrane component
VSELFYNIFSLSLTGSTVAIGLLLIKKLLNNKLDAHWHYILWFFLVLRLLLPYTPSSPIRALDLVLSSRQAMGSGKAEVPDTAELGGTAFTESVTGNANSVQETQSEDNSRVPAETTLEKVHINWTDLGWIWAVGMALISFYILLINLLMFLKTRDLPKCESENVLRTLQKCKCKLGVNANITVIYSDKLNSPAVFGLFSKKIIISPELIKGLAPEELHYIFMHEVSHIKRHDLITDGLIILLQVIYWFNPLIWYALSQMKQDCEIACDATALAFLQQEDRKKYGLTMINLLELLSEPHWAPGTLGFISKFNERRIVMMAKSKKTKITWAVTTAGLALVLFAGFSIVKNPIKSPDAEADQANAQTQEQQTTDTGSTDQNSGTAEVFATPSPSANSDSIVYENTDYGFRFVLPKDWKGYSIVNSSWEGLAMAGESGEKVAEVGPIISLRNPQWTSQTPTQDIPIMVFTLAQWNSLQKGDFWIGAAPIGPSKLGSNNRYVFAIPARYNFAFPKGYEEVESILEGNPLTTTQLP